MKARGKCVICDKKRTTHREEIWGPCETKLHEEVVCLECENSLAEETPEP